MFQGEETDSTCKGPEAETAVSKAQAGGLCGWSREKYMSGGGVRPSEWQGQAAKFAGVCRSLICIPTTVGTRGRSEGVVGGVEKAFGILEGRVGGRGWPETWVWGGERGIYIPQGGEERAQCPLPRKV